MAGADGTPDRAPARREPSARWVTTEPIPPAVVVTSGVPGGQRFEHARWAGRRRCRRRPAPTARQRCRRCKVPATSSCLTVSQQRHAAECGRSPPDRANSRLEIAFACRSRGPPAPRAEASPSRRSRYSNPFFRTSRPAVNTSRSSSAHAETGPHRAARTVGSGLNRFGIHAVGNHLDAIRSRRRARWPAARDPRCRP